MNAELISIGTELLLGDIVNTNSAFLARELAALGINVFHQSVVGDNAERLKDSLALALSRADIVVTTGGLGPTYDDITKQTVASMLGLAMKRHAPSAQKIEAFFARRGAVMTPNNLLQADVPRGATVFPNDSGAAPGIAVSHGGKQLILLPGPPSEMRPMFTGHVAAFLQAQTDSTICSKTLHIFGMGESQVEDVLRDLMTSSQNPTVAPYAAKGEVKVRVSAKAADAGAAHAMIGPVVETVKQALGGAVYGVDIGSLQNALVRELAKKRLTAATAESCTGGMVAAAITAVPGASAVFTGGVCAYSNALKQSLLRVRPETLARHGAVSAETAREMAWAARSVAAADIGVGVTGIAGPGGGTDEKPVGLVYVAVDSAAYRETKKLLLARGHKDERDSIRHMAMLHALSLMLKAAREA